MKILLVEDEPKTGEYLRQGLSEAGFVVDWTQDGAEGLNLALQSFYDLVILDVMLPGLDGWQVLQSLRGRGLQMPVLFLTARDEVTDRVKVWSWVPTTTWSSLSRSPNCWLACGPSCGVAAVAPKAPRCVWPTWNWTCCAAACTAAADAST